MNEVPPTESPAPESVPHDQSQATSRTTGLPSRFLISSGVFLALALAAIWVLPHLDAGRNGGTQPGYTTFFGVGLVLILFTGGLVYFGLRSHYGAMRLVLINTIAFNSLIVLVKFAFAPASLYAANVERDLNVFIDSAPVWVAATAIGVFLLYAMGFWLLHALVSLRFLQGSARVWAVVLPVLIFCGLLASGGGLMLLLGLDYLTFVFSTPAALFIAIAVAGAVALAGATINTIGRQTQMIRDTTLLASFLWIGLGFIALYHVLWFVYMLVLVSIWPLRTVVPK